MEVSWEERRMEWTERRENKSHFQKTSEENTLLVDLLLVDVPNGALFLFILLNVDMSKMTGVQLDK